MKKGYLLLGIAASVLVAPGAWAAGLTEKALKNVTAIAPDMAEGGTHPVKFKNGEHNNGSDIDRILHTAVGDLNGDGMNDGAIVYYETWGGSGAFMRMAVFLYKNGKPVQIGERTLGDRSHTRSLKIKNKVLTLDIMTHRENDGASNPTKHKVVHFRVKNRKLIGPEEIDWTD